MAGSNPIKYKDLIKSDDSISVLIGELNALKDVYTDAVDAIKKGAAEMQNSLKNTSGVTEDNRKKIDEAAAAASRLERAQKELKFAISDTGKQVALLKNQTSEANRSTVEQDKQVKATVNSYNKVALELKELVSLYKSLTSAERADVSMGGQILQQLLDRKSTLAQLNSQMKEHVVQSTEVQKAEQKLAYLRSDEGKKLLTLKAQIAAVTAEYSKQSQQANPLVAAQEKLAYARSDENEQLKLYSTQIKEANQVAQLTAQINSSAEGSYNRLSAQYSLNKIKLNQMSAAEREAAQSGQLLEKETQDIYNQMIKLQEATGNYRLSVGNYGKAWDGLSYSVTQVVRELPAAAVSLNTFFLGISNNVPMVVDEINQLRLQNKALAAEGKPVVSVTKSIVKALFSWQSALVVLLTVFSMFGTRIGDFIASLFKGEAAILSTGKALSSINEELTNNTNSYGQNAVALKKLANEWENLTSKKEQLKWIEDNKSEFDSLGIAINGVADAENAFVDNTAAVIEALKLRAKASAASELASKEYEKALLKENEIALAKSKGPSWVEQLVSYASSSGGSITGIALTQQTISAEDLYEERLENMEKERLALIANGDAFYEYSASYESAALKILKAGNIDESTGKTSTSTSTAKTSTSTSTAKTAKEEAVDRDLTDAINRETLSIQTKYEESLTRLEQKEFAKRRKEALATYNERIGLMQNQYEKNERILANEEGEYKELTDAQKKQVEEAQETITATIISYTQERDLELSNIERDRQIKELQLVNETIQLRLEAVKKGSQEELELRLAAIDAERAIALASNAKLPTDEQVDPSVISSVFAKQTLSVSIEFDMTSFDQQQALEAASFEAVKHTETEITKFKLEQERDRWNKLIDLAEAGSLEWDEAQTKAAKKTVKGIEEELSGMGSFVKRMGEQGLGKTLLELLGFDKDQIDALSNMTDIVLEQLGDILDANVELAQLAVDAAQERVDAAQSAYDAEVEARNNGYASSVATAKQELALEEENQLQKEKLLAEAERRQEALDTAIQANSLITASAQLWSAFSSIPIVGPALAIAAIATMWGSFAAAKIKAKQVTASSENYGEGGLEFLEGGSHASGNDIGLNTKNSKGKHMRAEGGEAMAIINKKSTRKYKSVLPEIVNSLNQGLFEDKYANAFSGSSGGLNINIDNGTNIDLSSIENDVRDIRRTNQTKITPLLDGTVVKVRKNVTRRIKN